MIGNKFHSLDGPIGENLRKSEGMGEWSVKNEEVFDGSVRFLTRPGKNGRDLPPDQSSPRRRLFQLRHRALE